MSLSYLCNKLKSITEEPEDLERIEYEVKKKIEEKLKWEKIEKVKKELLKQIPNPYTRTYDPWIGCHLPLMRAQEQGYNDAIEKVARLIVEESL